MALMINEDCVNCMLCEPECPNGAISTGDGIYVIDPEKCTECVGYHDNSRCTEVCAVECIESNPDWIETREQLEIKAKRLKDSAITVD
jgi:ferredoxin